MPEFPRKNPPPPKYFYFSFVGYGTSLVVDIINDLEIWKESRERERESSLNWVLSAYNYTIQTYWHPCNLNANSCGSPEIFTSIVRTLNFFHAREGPTRVPKSGSGRYHGSLTFLLSLSRIVLSSVNLDCFYFSIAILSSDTRWWGKVNNLPMCGVALWEVSQLISPAADLLETSVKLWGWPPVR